MQIKTTWYHYTLIVVQSLSRVWLFETPRTAALQVSLSLHCLLKFASLMAIDSVMPSNHLILCCPLLLLQSFPASGSFPVSWLFASGGQSIGASASASVLPMNIQDWFSLGLTGLISLLSKGLSKVFSSTKSSESSVLWCSVCFIFQLSHPYMTTGKTITFTSLSPAFFVPASLLECFYLYPV